MSLGFDDEQEQERVRGRSRRRPDLQAGTPSGHEEGASDGIRRVRQARERAREEGLTEQEDVPAGSGISADRESRPARTGAEHHSGTRPETAAQWLSDPSVSPDGVNFSRIPDEAAAAFADQVAQTATVYENLYG